MVETGIRIYKCNTEGFQSDGLKRHSVFDFEGMDALSRMPFGSLHVFNEEILSGRKSVAYKAGVGQVILIPLYGAIDVVHNGKSHFLHIEQAGVFSWEEDSSFEISNPYEQTAVKYLQIRIKDGDNSIIHPFQLENRNVLSSIIINEDSRIAIGLFDGRKAGVYHLSKSANRLFAYVISGAFEVEDCLLETGDALGLTKVRSIAFEALSENALLLLLEMK